MTNFDHNKFERNIIFLLIEILRHKLNKIILIKMELHVNEILQISEKFKLNFLI
jgi:hypothetical protein